MRMHWKILCGVVLSAFVAILLGQACSNLGAPGYDESSFNVEQGPLIAAPMSATLQGGATLQINASGGEPPYSYTITSGLGSVSPSGLYTAPTTISGSTQTVIIAVNDQDPQTTSAYTTIQLVANSLGATYTPANPRKGDAVVIYASGGTPPYYFQILSGGGNMLNNVYQAPNNAETARINILDALNLQTTVTIQIQ